MAEKSSATGLGKAIHLRRVELGMKRMDVANGANLSYPYISEIENGVKQPSVAALGRIAEALGLSVSELTALSEQYAEEPQQERSVWMPKESAAAPARHPYAAASVTEDPSASLEDRASGVAAFSRSELRRPSQLLRSETVQTAPASAPMVDEAEIGEVVRRVVAEELLRWERDRLPELVRTELRRRLDQAMGTDDR